MKDAFHFRTECEDEKQQSRSLKSGPAGDGEEMNRNSKVKEQMFCRGDKDSRYKGGGGSWWFLEVETRDKKRFHLQQGQRKDNRKSASKLTANEDGL